MHKNLVKIARVIGRYPRAQTDRQTHTHTQRERERRAYHNTSQPLTNMQMSRCKSVNQKVSSKTKSILKILSCTFRTFKNYLAQHCAWQESVITARRENAPQANGFTLEASRSHAHNVLITKYYARLVVSLDNDRQISWRNFVEPMALRM